MYSCVTNLLTTIEKKGSFRVTYFSVHFYFVNSSYIPRASLYLHIEAVHIFTSTGLHRTFFLSVSLDTYSNLVPHPDTKDLWGVSLCALYLMLIDYFNIDVLSDFY